jgi:small subunit ribosomal protein S4
VARNLDPKCRQCRREGEKLFLKGDKCFTDKCAIERRNYPPGQHGQKNSRLSGYGVQLREKQKLRRIYGLLERQFRNTYHHAEKKKGITGETLLQMLEQRLDNVVYRMGFAITRPAARQLVSHRGVTVNGKPVNLPSYAVKAGDAIALSERAQKQLRVQESVTVAQQMDLSPAWVEVDAKKFAGVFKAVPDRAELPADINEALIVELYSK